MVAGGIAARHELFPLPAAMAAASVGSFLADQLWFAVGRYARDRPFVARQRARPAFARVLGMLERHPRAFIFGFRFVYGIRTISPIAIGTSRVPGRVFLPVNATAAVVWGCAFTLVGWAFGRAVEHALHHLRPSAAEAAIAATVLLLIALGWHRWRGRRSPRLDSAPSLAEHGNGTNGREGDG